MSLDLDLRFLSEPLPAPPAPRPDPVNVYEILRDGWRETRVDLTLHYFLDPTERHGLGSLVVDALLNCVDGARTAGPEGLEDEFSAGDSVGSTSWQILTQYEYIDVLAVDPEQRLGIVIENKLGHELHNRLDIYAQAALRRDDVDRVLVVVLAPEHRSPDEIQKNWLSRSITYAELADQIRTDRRLLDMALSPQSLDERRSIDLLQQFIEARTKGPAVTDPKHEAPLIDRWRAVLDEHREAIAAFDATRQRMNRLRKDRNARLAEVLASRLGQQDFPFDFSDEKHGSNTHQSWNAYYFPQADRTVELKLSTGPADDWSVFLYTYPGRSYEDATTEQLGPGWDIEDEALADLFVARCLELLRPA